MDLSNQSVVSSQDAKSFSDRRLVSALGYHIVYGKFLLFCIFYYFVLPIFQPFFKYCIRSLDGLFEKHVSEILTCTSSLFMLLLFPAFLLGKKIIQWTIV